MKDNGKVIEVIEETFGDKVTRLKWGTDNGHFGELTIKYLDNGHYNFDAEFIGLELIAEILKFWIENKN